MTFHIKAHHLVVILSGLFLFTSIRFATAADSVAEKTAPSRISAKPSGSETSSHVTEDTPQRKTGATAAQTPIKTPNSQSDAEKIAALEGRIAALEAIIAKDGNDVKITAAGKIKIDSHKSIEMTAQANVNIVGEDVTLVANRNLAMSAKKNGEVKSSTLKLESQQDLKLKSGGDLDIHSGTNMSLKAKTAMQLESLQTNMKSSGILNIEGSQLKLNNGKTPAARLTDKVVVAGATGTIIGGSPTVLLP